METIVFNERQIKRPKKSKKIYLIALIIGLLGAITYLYVENFNVVNTLLTFTRAKVIYNTYTISFDSDISEEYKQKITEDIASLVYDGKKRFEIVDSGGDINIESSKKDNNVEIFSDTLIPVGHMYSLKTKTDSDDIKDMNVYILNEVYASYLSSQYGVTAHVVDSVDELVEAMKDSDSNVGLVDFSDLGYRMKVLYVDGGYYLDDPTAGIPIHFYAQLDSKVTDFVLSVLKKNITGEEAAPVTSSRLKLNMSGVVAISRGLITKIEAVGDDAYPAESLGSFLADADLTHVSNEVSFVNGCTATNGMTFCSKPGYLATLLKSGVDIVELTGNHNNDYGSTANMNTINTYVDNGMVYFGGGLNKEDAAKILYEDVNGTKLAFIGYNYYDTMLKSGAIAWGDTAGANSYSDKKLKADIAEAKDSGADVIIVDFQYQECYCYPDGDVVYPLCYQPLSNPDQEATFRLAIDDGATIVIGTQAHQPQTYELYNGGVIFYGLGNLYFDQDNWIGTRQGLILTHYFYNGKYVQTKITPIYMDSSLQPKLATTSQASQLLKSLKTARDTYNW